MWNWLVSSLAVGATVVLYDGAPLIRRRPILWDMAADERITVFGTSAKWLALAEKEGLQPIATHDLGALKAILSTGSPLADAQLRLRLRAREARRAAEQHQRRHRHHLVLRARQSDRPCVARRAADARARHEGRSVRRRRAARSSGEQGELVCTAPFPSMPVAFWNDPDGAKYRAAYFERYPEHVAPRRLGGAHGARRHDHLRPQRRDAQSRRRAHRHGGDLPPGRAAAGDHRESRHRPGHRERRAAPTCASCCSCGCAEGVSLTDALKDRIRAQIRANASPHHVPKKIIQVADIPRTISGKITELAVRDVVHGRPVKNVDALANPAGAGAVSESAGAGD